MEAGVFRLSLEKGENQGDGSCFNQCSDPHVYVRVTQAAGHDLAITVTMASFSTPTAPTRTTRSRRFNLAQVGVRTREHEKGPAAASTRSRAGHQRER